MKDFLDKYLNKENRKKIIDWCIANRRFFLAAVLFVALLVLLRACTGQGTTAEPGEVSGTEQSTENTGILDFELDSDFEQDAHEEVNNLVDSYFAAYAAADFDTLETIASPISENEKSYISVFSAYIESYENIVCYTKAGLTDDSYLVSAYFDLKFYDVETTAPGLEFFYVETSEDGSAIINNRYSSYNLSRTENDLDPSIYAVILKFEQQEDSVALREQVEDAYAEAIASDVDLATMLSSTIPNAMSDWMSSLTETDAGESTEQPTEEETGADETNTDAADTGADETNTDAAETGADETNTDAADTGTDGTNTDAADTGDGAQDETVNQVVKVKITAKTVNVRKEPSTSSDVLGKVKRNETYTELEDLGDWFAISYNGQTGYVSADYVTEVTE